ncbi:hypothetical protein CTEN210_17042 [Chaetoceros tenuissimus]|uniref:Uncharacterized protein n=1 Tax=Chaetoceros tenuissimus TaxID=426638 RepID=A0AAD3D9V7_9STRA|nr:hypothetical protein CTEN210_17042 [Chaetoceros tenuissimus]
MRVQKSALIVLLSLNTASCWTIHLPTFHEQRRTSIIPLFAAVFDRSNGDITKQQRMSIERQIELDVEQAVEKFMDLYKVEVEEHSAKWKSHVGRKVEDSSGTSTIEVKEESKSSGDSSTTTTKTTSSLKFSFAVAPRPHPDNTLDSVYFKNDQELPKALNSFEAMVETEVDQSSLETNDTVDKAKVKKNDQTPVELPTNQSSKAYIGNSNVHNDGNDEVTVPFVPTSVAEHIAAGGKNDKEKDNKASREAKRGTSDDLARYALKTAKIKSILDESKENMVRGKRMQIETEALERQQQVINEFSEMTSQATRKAQDVAEQIKDAKEKVKEALLAAKKRSELFEGNQRELLMKRYEIDLAELNQQKSTQAELKQGELLKQISEYEKDTRLLAAEARATQVLQEVKQRAAQYERNQRALLEKRIEIDLILKDRARSIRIEANQRALLIARLQYEAKMRLLKITSLQEEGETQEEVDTWVQGKRSDASRPTFLGDVVKKEDTTASDTLHLQYNDHDKSTRSLASQSEKQATSLPYFLDEVPTSKTTYDSIETASLSSTDLPTILEQQETESISEDIQETPAPAMNDGSVSSFLDNIAISKTTYDSIETASLSSTDLPTILEQQETESISEDIQETPAPAMNDGSVSSFLDNIATSKTTYDSIETASLSSTDLPTILEQQETESISEDIQETPAPAMNDGSVSSFLDNIAISKTTYDSIETASLSSTDLPTILEQQETESISEDIQETPAPAMNDGSVSSFLDNIATSKTTYDSIETASLSSTDLPTILEQQETESISEDIQETPAPAMNDGSVSSFLDNIATSKTTYDSIETASLSSTDLPTILEQQETESISEDIQETPAPAMNDGSVSSFLDNIATSKTAYSIIKTDKITGDVLTKLLTEEDYRKIEMIDTEKEETELSNRDTKDCIFDNKDTPDTTSHSEELLSEDNLSIFDKEKEEYDGMIQYPPIKNVEGETKGSATSFLDEIATSKSTYDRMVNRATPDNGYKVNSDDIVRILEETAEDIGMNDPGDNYMEICDDIKKILEEAESIVDKIDLPSSPDLTEEVINNCEDQGANDISNDSEDITSILKEAEDLAAEIECILREQENFGPSEQMKREINPVLVGGDSDETQSEFEWAMLKHEQEMKQILSINVSEHDLFSKIEGPDMDKTFEEMMLEMNENYIKENDQIKAGLDTKQVGVQETSKEKGIESTIESSNSGLEANGIDASKRDMETGTFATEFAQAMQQHQNDMEIFKSQAGSISQKNDDSSHLSQFEIEMLKHRSEMDDFKSKST